MESFLEFVKGPLFRLAFGIMVLGLARNLFLSISNMIQVWSKAGDKTINWKLVIKRTMQWMFPFGRLFRSRPLYSVMSILFHVGVILVPIFLFAHIELWKLSIGISWPALGQTFAHYLSILTIIMCFGLFIGRVAFKESRKISRPQDYIWPLLIVVPFISGFLAAHPNMNPINYNLMMIIHMMSSEIIFIFVPFTKIAHSVLLPISHLVSELGWHFPAMSGKNVGLTLGKEGEPV